MMETFRLLEINPPTQKRKKYSARVILPEGNVKTVHFGASDYQHYQDRTPLKLWKHLDHFDKTRRENYRKRHSKNTGIAGQLALKYLW